MAGSIKVAGHELVSHDIATDKLVYGTGVPVGTIIESKSTSNSGYSSFTDNTFTAITGFNQQIDVKSSNSKMLIFLFLAGAGAENNTSLGVNLTETITSLDQILTEISGFTSNNDKGFDQTTLFYEHSHGQSVGTTLTYTPKFRSSYNLSSSFVNNYTFSNGNAHSVILVQELMQ